MPTGTLPASGKAIWEKVYKKALSGSCKDQENPKECASKTAWTAVKNAGWRKDSDGKWTQKAALAEFSLTIKRAAFDKTVQEMRWRADTSDIEEDSRRDNMTQELYADFLRYVENGQPVPEKYRSDFWEGGMPYISISHYPDNDGKSVPGKVENVYVDGKFLKAKGTFDDTPLGRACFRALCDDLYGEKENSNYDRIRISIAFLDYAHRHKSDGTIFERKEIGDICPQCLAEMLGVEERAGVEYLKGQLIHLALTRVPVNDRTLMEVDRSMTTRKEDAASIVGEELAEELENETVVVGKSEALVIKAEDAVDTESVTESVNDTEVPTEIVEEAKPSDKKKDKKMEDDEEDDMDDEEEPKKKKAEVSKSESVDEVSLVALQKDILALKSAIIAEPAPEHPLDAVISKLKSDFDEAVGVEMTADEKLQLIQESYTNLGHTIKSLIETPKAEEKAEVESDNDLVKALAQVMSPLGQKIDLLINRLDVQTQRAESVPVPRNLQPDPSLRMKMQSSASNVNSVVTKQVSDTPKLRAILERTT